MKKKVFYVFVTILMFGLTACNSQQILSAANKALEMAKEGTGLTNAEVVQGLKEALQKGVISGSSQASKVDGYLKNPLLKIAFPPDAEKVEKKLRQLGMGAQVDRFVTSMNRGAEEAAKKAAPIFVSAIKQMSIQDAMGILKGNKNAATSYLKTTTTQQLMTAYQPVVQASLDKTYATKYYTDLVNTYNQIPLVKKVNPDLNDYASQKAVDGLFVLVEKEEVNIRENVAARTSDILKKVFGYTGE